MSTRLSNLTRPPTQKRDAIAPGLSKAVYITSLTLMVFIAGCTQKNTTWPTEGEGEGEPEPQGQTTTPQAQGQKKDPSVAPLHALKPIPSGDESLSENDNTDRYTAKNSPSGLYQAFRQMCIRIAMEVGYDEIAQTKVFRSTDSDIGPTETVVETQLIGVIRHATITITPPSAPDGDGYFIKIGQDVYRVFTSPLVIQLTYNPKNKRSLKARVTQLGFPNKKIEQTILEKLFETIGRTILRTT